MSSELRSNIFKIFDLNQSNYAAEFQSLEYKLFLLEGRLKKIMDVLVKKEANINALTNDLVHIVDQLKRLEVVK